MLTNRSLTSDKLQPLSFVLSSALPEQHHFFVEIGKLEIFSINMYWNIHNLFSYKFLVTFLILVSHRNTVNPRQKYGNCDV